jgi:4-hydroxy-2-oxoheptanedioate aldolase
MQFHETPFKRRLLAGEAMTGLWLGLANPYAAEMAATAGFDWLLLDGEHSPNDLKGLLGQLQAIAPYASHPIVRPPVGDPVLIKQYLDIGVQTLLVPMVETADQAAGLVAAMRYPPRGIRGVGHVLARAAHWGQRADYLAQADDELCLLVQVETLQGLENLEVIATTEGVDGVFIGPADLSAAMGHLGNPGHPEVRSAIHDAISRVRAVGKVAGIVTVDEDEARGYLDAGCGFVGVGIDTLLLMTAMKKLAERFRPV